MLAYVLFGGLGMQLPNYVVFLCFAVIFSFAIASCMLCRRQWLKEKLLRERMTYYLSFVPHAILILLFLGEIVSAISFFRYVDNATVVICQIVGVLWIIVTTGYLFVISIPKRKF